ncbi:hypothetical protein [Roseicyclus sp.]|uniref:hypothetical protein n=1 Tax=Roseicyclus sp. TaxID=1914329 RepID=UPI003F6B5F47
MSGLWPARGNSQTQASVPAELPAPGAVQGQAAQIADVATPDMPPRAPAPSFSALGLPCGLSVTATAMPGAMVALDVFDPCRPEATLEIAHAGLSFSARTDVMGLLTVDIPALETPAFITIISDTGDETMAIAGLPDLAEYARVAVTWDGDLGLELHAFENDADFGAPGHIWQEMPGDMAAMLAGNGGFLTTLGDPRLLASGQIQIYTVPQTRAADVRLSLDIPIKPETCGRPLRAQAKQLSQSGGVDIWPITVTLPGCDGVGDFLVLQNLFDAPRLAAN